VAARFAANDYQLTDIITAPAISISSRLRLVENSLGSFQGGFLLISHDHRLVENVADRLYLLEEGRLRLV